MNKKQWWHLTDAELARLNPPLQNLITDDNDNDYLSVICDDAWLPVGYIPRPSNRFEWLLYDLCHGFAMRYPWHKVLGFAFSSLLISRNMVVNIDMNKLKWVERDGRMVAETEYGEFEYVPHLPVSGEPHEP